MIRRTSLFGGVLAILILAAGCNQNPLGPELEAPAVDASFNRGKSGDNIQRGGTNPDRGKSGENIQRGVIGGDLGGGEFQAMGLPVMGAN